MYVIFPSKAFRGSEVCLKRTAITCMTINITTQNRQVLFLLLVFKVRSSRRTKRTERYRAGFITEMVELMWEKMETNRKPEDRLRDQTISTQANTFFAKKSCIFFPWQDSTTQSLKIQQYIGQYGTNSSTKVTVYTINHRDIFKEMATQILCPPHASVWINPKLHSFVALPAWPDLWGRAQWVRRNC